MSTVATGVAPLFQPLEIGALPLQNRIAVAPMTRVSADAEGHSTDAMADYYTAFARGGFGLVITEGIYTDDAWSQGYLFQPGLVTSQQRDAWHSVVKRVHDEGGCIFAQLMHAGALSQGNRFRTDTRGPSAVRPAGKQMTFYRGEGSYRVPQAMTEAEIAEAIDGFAAAAALAREAGFDGVEVHGANGYLLDQFLSRGINLREDDWGGSLEGRLRLTVQTINAVRDKVGRDFVVGLRSSQGKVNDFTYKWDGVEEAEAIYRRFGELALDYLHTTEFEAWKPAFEKGASLVSLAKRNSGLPILANGSLHDPGRASAMLDAGDADFVSLGRGALAQSDWPQIVASGNVPGDFDSAILSPIADLSNAERFNASWR